MLPAASAIPASPSLQASSASTTSGIARVVGVVGNYSLILINATKAPFWPGWQRSYLYVKILCIKQPYTVMPSMPAAYAVNYSLTWQRNGVTVRCGRRGQGGDSGEAGEAGRAGDASRAEWPAKRAVPHRPRPPTRPYSPRPQPLKTVKKQGHVSPAMRASRVSHVSRGIAGRRRQCWQRACIAGNTGVAGKASRAGVADYAVGP